MWSMGLLTIWRGDIRDVGVVGGLSGQESHSRRAADGRGAKMLLEQCSLLNDVLVDVREVIQRVHVQILVISQDEDDVWSSGVGGRNILRGLTERYLRVGRLSAGQLDKRKGRAEE